MNNDVHVEINHGNFDLWLLSTAILISDYSLRRSLRQFWSLTTHDGNFDLWILTTALTTAISISDYSPRQFQSLTTHHGNFDLWLLTTAKTCWSGVHSESWKVFARCNQIISVFSLFTRGDKTEVCKDCGVCDTFFPIRMEFWHDVSSKSIYHTWQLDEMENTTSENYKRSC